MVLKVDFCQKYSTGPQTVLGPLITCQHPSLNSSYPHFHPRPFLPRLGSKSFYRSIRSPLLASLDWATQQSEEKAEHYEFCNVLTPFNKLVDTRRKSSTDVGQTEIKEGHEKRKVFKCWKSYHLPVSRRCAK